MNPTTRLAIKAVFAAAAIAALSGCDEPPTRPMTSQEATRAWQQAQQGGPRPADQIAQAYGME